MSTQNSSQTAAGQYRTRPRVVTALRFTGDNFAEVCELVGQPSSCQLRVYGSGANRPFIVIDMPEGQVAMRHGDWVVRESDMSWWDFRLMSDETFRALHEPCETLARETAEWQLGGRLPRPPEPPVPPAGRRVA